MVDSRKFKNVLPSEMYESLFSDDFDKLKVKYYTIENKNGVMVGLLGEDIEENRSFKNINIKNDKNEILGFNNNDIIGQIIKEVQMLKKRVQFIEESTKLQSKLNIILNDIQTHDKQETNTETKEETKTETKEESKEESKEENKEENKQETKE